MFVEDLKNDFYLKIKGKRVLILVNYDIDAICTCKILQSLFSTDGVLYSVVSVDLVTDLYAAFHERRADERHVLLINCGGTIDLVEYLEPREDVDIFVLDSHRPLDVCNVYNTGQIKIISRPEDVELVPDFYDLFRDDSDEESEQEDEDLDENGLEALMEKKRKRREWEKKKDELMFEYQQYSYYSRSSSATAFDLAWKLSKDNFDLLWYAIVGVSEQLLLNKLDEDGYLSECGKLQQHISRLQHRGTAAPDDRGISLNIEYQKQLRLAMYRNWTVEASMLNSVTTASQLRLWTFDGIKRLHEMLAEIGIPLMQCRQKFSSMQALYRQELQEAVVQVAPRYNLTGIELGSFSLLFGYRAPVPAMDAVYGLIGLLIADKSKSERFLDGLEALARTRRDRLEEGMVTCQKLLQTIARMVQSALETGQLRPVGPFLLLALQEESPLLSHPYSILLLAEFALKAYAGRRHARQMLPLLVSTPCGDQVDGAVAGDALCHIAAVAPLAEFSGKTFFGRAFERTAEQSRTEILARYFDSSVIQIRLKDRGKFFDAMVALLG